MIFPPLALLNDLQFTVAYRKMTQMVLVKEFFKCINIFVSAQINSAFSPTRLNIEPNNDVCGYLNG